MSSDYGKMTFREQMRGFPLFQMFIISLIRFTEPIAFTSFFPYVYFMLIGFGVPENETWRYSSYYAASFAFFQFLFSISWCKASDKFGRKPTLLVSLLGSALSMLVFGFAKSYFVGLIARSMMGGFTVIAIIRTIIGEIATEKRHQSIAYLTLPAFWNIGVVLAPLIGSSKYLVRVPADIANPNNFLSKIITVRPISVSTAEGFYDSFMDKYPYALSNIVIAAYIILNIFIGFLFLEETHPDFKGRRDYGLELGDLIRTGLGYEVPIRPWKSEGLSRTQSNVTDNNSSVLEIESIDERTPLHHSHTSPRAFYNDQDVEDDALSTRSDDSVQSTNFLSKRASNAIVRRYSEIPQLHLTRTNTRDPDAVSIFTFQEGVEVGAFTKPVIQTITANFILSFHNIIYWEFIPVFLAGEFLKDEVLFPFTIRGGFGFDSATIGNLLSYTGLIGTLSIMILFPLIDRHMRAVVSYRCGQAVIPFVYLALPFMIFTLPDYNPKFKPGLTLNLLYCLSSLSTVCSSICFPQIFMLIHRASIPKHRSYINGASLSITSLARCIAPLLWGSLMSITEKYSISEVAWFSLALLAFSGFIQSLFLKDYDEDLKAEDEP